MWNTVEHKISIMLISEFCPEHMWTGPVFPGILWPLGIQNWPLDMLKKILSFSDFILEKRKMVEKPLLKLC